MPRTSRLHDTITTCAASHTPQQVVQGCIETKHVLCVHCTVCRQQPGSRPPHHPKGHQYKRSHCCPFATTKQVAILESLRGRACVVPLLDYGVLGGSRNNGLDPLHQQQQQQPQWVLVFPRYSGSLRAWRQARGAGLRQQEVELYLRVFLQVGAAVRQQQVNKDRKT